MSTIVTTVVSVITLLASFYFFKEASKSKGKRVIYFIVALLMIIFSVSYMSIDYFTDSGVNEAVVYHLKYGLEGAGFFEYKELIFRAIALLVVGIGALAVVTLSPSIVGAVLNTKIAFVLVFVSLLMNPLFVSIFKYQILQTEGANFAEYYKKADIKALKSKHKNLLFIYAESLERTYFDQSLFPNLMDGLMELEATSTHFSNIKQVEGTGWTVGGMTASQCGIPLFTASHRNSMYGMDQFLPSATCLGDLLNQEGYDLTYMGGATTKFAGKGNLYGSHGFNTVMGIEELFADLEDKEYRHGWGLYDDFVLDKVYKKFLELSAKDEKFGLFTLTLDTHHPIGHPSESCKNIKYKDGENLMLNSVACSDYLISTFIKKVLNSKYADNTTIVLMSDHLAMKNKAYDLLEKKEEGRTNMFMVFNGDESSPKRVDTLGSTLDVGPTILPFLGFDGSIGLGRNLLSDEILSEDVSYIHSSLLGWRSDVLNFWDFPSLNKGVMADPTTSEVMIDGRVFRMPVLIEFDNELNSTLKFAFDQYYVRDSLNYRVSQYRKKEKFLLFEFCKNLMVFDESFGEEGFCFLAGKGSDYLGKQNLVKPFTITADQIKNRFNLSN